ncbi:hypothetical protein GGR52DRAFT_179976 [Hypoxylon sp. FL1284]|nr:hypothetical protein GGR52DRAFT_179976 [Hypoxylon sp. FL1284]
MTLPGLRQDMLEPLGLVESDESSSAESSDDSSAKKGKGKQTKTKAKDTGKGKGKEVKKPSKSSKPVKSSGSSKAAKATETGKSSKSSKPVKSTKSVKPTKSSKSSGPSKSEKSTKNGKSGKVFNTIEFTKTNGKCGPPKTYRTYVQDSPSSSSEPSSSESSSSDSDSSGSDSSSDSSEVAVGGYVNLELLATMSTMYPDQKPVRADRLMSPAECHALSVIEARYRANKWLQLQCDFANLTGNRMVDPMILRRKFEELNGPESD